MHGTRTLRALVGLVTLSLAPLRAQQSNPFGGAPPDTVRPGRQASPATDGARTAQPGVGQHGAPQRFEGKDSVVYRLLPSSRLEIRTGKAGLFGFAGHSHRIRARTFAGQVVYYPKAPPSSHLEITVAADSLQVLTPPDTAEIRKVTETMRAEVLQVDRYPEIRLVSRGVTPSADGFQLVGALTLVGQTREVPIDVAVQFGIDTLRVMGTFSVKQTDFGIKPYSGGPAGTVKVADRVTFDVDAIAVQAERATSATDSR